MTTASSFICPIKILWLLRLYRWSLLSLSKVLHGCCLSIFLLMKGNTKIYWVRVVENFKTEETFVYNDHHIRLSQSCWTSYILVLVNCSTLTLSPETVWNRIDLLEKWPWNPQSFITQYLTRQKDFKIYEVHIEFITHLIV